MDETTPPDVTAAPGRPAPIPPSWAVHANVKPGDRIAGRYVLVDPLGRGGMGEVWHAQQFEPIRRSVALKLIRAGMDSSEVISRFNAERQALAQMAHPHIAQVYDAGTTDAGRPFFAMELVGGKPLTTYCDERKLRLRDRLELFATVCTAVEHAHTKGLIHRDLKPSNILVTEVDGKPVPKVIDFGIAKAVDAKSDHDATLTELGQVVGTPEYMSPEQAMGAGVDTRSDVYALGVILYELLVGRLPFSVRGSGRAEFERQLLDDEPAKPSDHLSTRRQKSDTDRMELASLADQRGTRPDTLLRALRQELEWIPLMALRKDPHRRYASAAQLAEDVRNYLDGKALRAGPESRRYRVSKFARRHRTAVAAMVLLALSITAGGGIATWQAVRATNAERRAEIELAKAEKVSNFLGSMLQGIAPSVAEGADTTLLYELLRRTEQRLDAELHDSPDVHALLLQMIAQAYAEANDLTRALDAARRSVAVLEAAPAKDPEMRRQLLGAKGLLGQLTASEDPDLAVRMLRDTYDQATAELGVDHDTTIGLSEQLGVTLFTAGDVAGCLELLQDAANRRTRLARTDPKTLLAQFNLGVAQYQAGQPNESAATIDAAITEARALVKSEGEESLHLLADLLEVRARLQIIGGNVDAALPLARESVAATERIYDEDHPRLHVARLLIAEVQAARGDIDGATRTFTAAIDGLARTISPDDRETLNARLRFGAMLDDAGRFDQARVQFDQALQAVSTGKGLNNALAVNVANHLATHLDMTGDYAGGLALNQQHLPTARALLGMQHTTTLTILHNIGVELTELGRANEALPVLAEALAGRRAVLGNDDPATLSTLQQQGMAKLRTRDIDGGRADLRDWSQGVEARFGSDSPEAKNAAAVLAKAEAGERP